VFSPALIKQKMATAKSNDDKGKYEAISGRSSDNSG